MKDKMKYLLINVVSLCTCFGMLEGSKSVVLTARGLVPPVFTPINEDQSINYDIIPTYAQYLAKTGVKAVLVGGSTGEHMCLNVEDRKKVIDAWLDVRNETGFHIQVQVGGAPLPDVLQLAKYCELVGVDSIMTLPELYFKPQTVDELVSYVKMVSDAAPSLPILYYHIPRHTKVELNMPSFVASATKNIPNFKGLKFSSTNLVEVTQILRILNDDQEIFLGGDRLLAPAAVLGVKSFIGPSYNLFPELVQNILEAVENNDIPAAQELQKKLGLAIDTVSSEGAWGPSVKAAMEIVTGIKVGPPILPQRPLSDKSKKRMEDKLRSVNMLK